MNALGEGEQAVRKRLSSAPRAARGMLLSALRLLAAGEPVAVDQIAAAVGDTPAAAARTLRQLANAEWGADGRLVSLVVSLKPTPHRITVSGRDLFVCCPLDALMLPAALEAPVAVETPCRITGTRVRIVATPDQVEAVDPAGAVIVVPDATDPFPARRPTSCVYQIALCDKGEASWWLRRHAGYRALNVREAYTYARWSASTL